MIGFLTLQVVMNLLIDFEYDSLFTREFRDSFKGSRPCEGRLTVKMHEHSLSEAHSALVLAGIRSCILNNKPTFQDYFKGTRKI